jgi:hypothetical protein
MRSGFDDLRLVGLELRDRPEAQNRLLGAPSSTLGARPFLGGPPALPGSLDERSESARAGRPTLPPRFLPGSVPSWLPLGSLRAAGHVPPFGKRQR